jgi:hypothetical protein
MSDAYSPRPDDVLVVKKPVSAPDFPQEPLLVLHARKSGCVSVMGIGARPRHPRWMSVERIRNFVREEVLAVERFERPPNTFTRVDHLTPAGLSEYNARCQAMKPLIDERGGLIELLAYPDEFARICRQYAERAGYKRKWIEKLAWLYLKNGRTLSALVGDRGNCGAPGRPRNFVDRVGGPKQTDGPDYDDQAASPYSVEQREQLKAITEQTWKNKKRQLTWDAFWIRVRARAEQAGLPLPSLKQCKGALEQLLARRRVKQSTGKQHVRYRGRKYASQEAEADSTELQAFTRSELDANVRLKNPVLYKIIEAKYQYVAAIYLTYEAPSNAVMAELLYRALVGMGHRCKELGLSYTSTNFPPLPPGKKLWVDNQELTSRKLDTALLTHLDWEVNLTIVAKGADKGKIEGNIGKDKKELGNRKEFFEKGSLGKAVARARSATDVDLLLLEGDLIGLADKHNHLELPASKVPREFVRTGRPCNRLELYKWDLERHRELIKPSPSEESARLLMLTTDFYPVHAGMGIFISPRYYVSEELIAAGYLEKKPRGKTPQVEVAVHRGTTNLVYWVRGPHHWVKCTLHESQREVLGDMTVAESDAHIASLPPHEKRRRRRLIALAAHQNAPKTRADRSRNSESAKKGHVTKDHQRNTAIRQAEVARAAHQDARRRFPEDLGERTTKRPVVDPTPLKRFDDEQAEMVAQLLAKRRKERQ